MVYHHALQLEKEHRGKDAVLSDLIRTHGRRLTRICYGYTKDWDDAREMAQEAFIKAYRAFDGFEGRSQPITWLTRIAINQCLSFLAARGRERLGLLNFLHEKEMAEEDSGWQRESSRVAIGRLMRSADPVTRKVLALIVHQGLSHSQIAATLGVSRVAITRRITRFKRKALGQLGSAA